MGKQWTEKEIVLTIESKSEAELALKYLKEFGTASTSRIYSLWSHRKSMISARGTVPFKESKKVIVDAKVPTRTVAFDEDKVLAHISNKLSDLIELEKEQMTQLQGINSGIIAMMELFRRLEHDKK